MAKTDYVFVSYAREDLELAQRIRDDLANAGIEVWFDLESLLPGQRWRTEIKQAIKDCSYFLALVSSNSISKRGYVQRELKDALEVLDELPPSKIFIIPVRLDQCSPEHEMLNELHWVDLFPSHEEGIEKILRAIGGSTTGSLTIEDPAIESPATYPTAQFEGIWADYDVTDGEGQDTDGEGALGLRIHVRFSVQSLRGRSCRAVAFFHFALGEPLKDFNSSYNTDDGNVSTAVDFTPGFDDAHYDDLSLYLPYEELHLVDGEHDLKFNVGLYSNDAGEYFAYSDWESFSVTQ